MTEYKATFNFNEVVTFKKALTVYKAVLEAQSGSAYELTHNDGYLRVCVALEEVEKHLQENKEMKIKRQLVFKNKITNKLSRLNEIKFYYDCGTYYDIFVHSKSWRSDERHLRLDKTVWEFIEFKEIEGVER